MYLFNWRGEASRGVDREGVSQKPGTGGKQSQGVHRGNSRRQKGSRR